LRQNPDFDLFHFNLQLIDEHHNIINNFYIFPEISTIEEFLLGKLQGGNFSTVVEYIFRKSHFYNLGRFQHFDLAWGSDDATWIKLGKNKGIRNIENSKVYWRKSPYNISPNDWDKDILERKYYAQIEFTKWVDNQAKQNNIRIGAITLKQKLKTSYFRNIKSKIKLLSFKTLSEILSRFYLTLDNKKCPRHIIAFIYLYKVYRFFKEVLKKMLFWDYFKLQKPKNKDFINFILPRFNK
jgi:hypothetical protein